MESHANSFITNGQIDSTYQRGYDVILCKLELNTVPLTQNLGFTSVSPAALSALVAHGKSKTLHKWPDITLRKWFWDKASYLWHFNIWQMTLCTFNSIFYVLYCCNYDVKVVICASNFWHFEGRVINLQFKDVNAKYNSLKLVIACGNVLKLFEQGWCFSVILECIVLEWVLVV